MMQVIRFVRVSLTVIEGDCVWIGLINSTVQIFKILSCQCIFGAISEVICILWWHIWISSFKNINRFDIWNWYGLICRFNCIVLHPSCVLFISPEFGELTWSWLSKAFRSGLLANNKPHLTWSLVSKISRISTIEFSDKVFALISHYLRSQCLIPFVILRLLQFLLGPNFGWGISSMIYYNLNCFFWFWHLVLWLILTCSEEARDLWTVNGVRSSRSRSWSWYTCSRSKWLFWKSTSSRVGCQQVTLQKFSLQSISRATSLSCIGSHLPNFFVHLFIKSFSLWKLEPCLPVPDHAEHSRCWCNTLSFVVLFILRFR